MWKVSCAALFIVCFRFSCFKVLGSPGNNLHEVETAEGDRFLASMPTKYRKNIWIKRGNEICEESNFPLAAAVIYCYGQMLLD